MPLVTTTEKRFREGSGERYLKDGSVRCQASSKARLRLWRQEHEDYEATTDDIWPECQCTRAAIPGMFACHWHGGRTPSHNKPKSIFDVIPLDLGDKLRVLLEDPDYLSRKEDILLLKARQWEILLGLQEKVGGEEAWGMVNEALVELKRGNNVACVSLLEDALAQTKEKEEAWKEWEAAEELLKDLTNTEVKTQKEMKQMASIDQITAFVNSIFEVILRGAEKYIDSPVSQSQFIQFVAGEIGRSANISPAILSKQLGAGG